MTDNEIIKALECCNQEDMCDKCPYDFACYDEDYKSILAKDALDLINRQKAEIERLKEENKKQKMVLENINDTIHPLPFVTDFDVAIKTAKSEAIKEFVSALKGKVVSEYEYVDIRVFKEIDALAKEMTDSVNYGSSKTENNDKE